MPLARRLLDVSTDLQLTGKTVRCLQFMHDVYIIQQNQTAQV